MPLSAAELEAGLEDSLDAVLSSRRTVSVPARELAELDDAAQRFALKWLDVVCASNAELGYHFITRAAGALARLPPADAEAWVVEALDVYDRQGLFPATAALSDLDAFLATRATRERGVNLDTQRGFIERFLRGLSGRGMKVAAGDDAHTNTETVFLPRAIDRADTPAGNRLLYKAMATHLWAMNRFGTFRRPAPDAPTLRERLAAFEDAPGSTRLFYNLEAVRLDACIARELPGLAREIERVFPPRIGADLAQAAADLARPDATVEDTLRWTRELAAQRIDGAPLRPYQGYGDLEAAETLTAERLDEDRDALQRLIQDLIDQMQRGDLAPEGDENADIELDFDQDGPATQYRLMVGGKPLAVPVALRERIDSILQDLDSVPEDWITADGEPGDEAAEGEPGKLPEPASGDPMFVYDEWDYQRGHYRKDWCVLYEREVPRDDPGFYRQTLARHHGIALDLRRAFEMLRDTRQTLRRQPQGEDIDIDAAVDAATDHRLGRELSDRLFIKTHRHERDIAVMFMVDLSGSTKGWIVDAEREALVLLCEALEILGDRYGIYGFSGMTRKRCELFRIKRLSEPLGDDVKARIAGIMPRDYTRMGVTIRHLTRLMDEVDARTRLLITLSDGKPDDYDGYRGDYGIEDTRKALIEARNRGIHPFCITIDRRAGEYLPHMYGAVNYTVVDDVRKLPAEVSKVYCRLTR